MQGDIWMDQQLRKLIDDMPGGFFLYHADDKEDIIYANKALLRIFNCDTMEEFTELTGNSFRGMVHPDDLEAVEQSIAEQIRESRYDLDYVEYRIIPKGGGIRWVEDYGHFMHDELYGDIFYVFVGDATEKRKRQFEEQSRRLEVIEGLSIDYESIFYANLDTDRIKAYRVSNRFQKQFPPNRQTCRFTGFDSDYIEEWVYPDDREFLRGVTDPEYIRQKLSEDKSFHVNYRIYRNGKPTYIQLRIVNTGSEDHISQIVLGYRNIDAEIMQELTQKQILADALAEAKLANNAKNTFLSNMSHDILTPMNAIVGFTSLAQKYIHDTDKVLGYLDMITASSSQLLTLLNDTLEISRIESGKIYLEESECDLLNILHQVQAEILPRAAEKNITLSLDIINLQHEKVFTDQSKLCRIFRYLVDNAVKYTKEGGRISVCVTEQEKTDSSHIIYRFIVEDSGIGMNEEFLPHIFEPFEREKNTTLSGIPGTGLGLTITRALVKILGGTIEVSSIVGTGSKFTVELPLRTSELTSEESKPETADSLYFKKPVRVLVVDDNELNLEIELEVLKDAGFLVESANDGSIALEMVAQSAPGYYDLILMDIQMPIMNGYRATEAIRRLKNPILANIPIIAVSANTFEEDKKLSLKSGMNAHLGKPLDTPRLYQLIRHILSNLPHL
ncbi:MAG: response regulator [Roseburia sp.]|nr:response regulator [Roseburia sp.]